MHHSFIPPLQVFSHRLFAICLPLFVSLMLAHPFEGIHHLRKQDSDLVLRTSTFAILDRVELLPAPVKAAFARSVKGEFFSMANPGQTFQMTDVIAERDLPHRRLIFAAESKDLLVLHYEMGGRGHSYHILFFKISGSSAKLAWRAVSDRKLNSIEDLKLAIVQNTLADNLAFFW